MAGIRIDPTVPQASPEATEDAASAELEDLRDFFDNAAVGLHWVDASGVILRANQCELDLLGFDAAEYIGHNISEFHQSQEVLADILARLGRGETLHNYPATMVAKDGSARHVLIDSSVRFVDGEFGHTRCLTREITDQVHAEQALRETEALYHSLVGVLPALVVTTSPTGEIEDVDDNYREYTGLTREEARDWRQHQVIHPDDLDRAMAVWTTAIASGEPMQNEMRLRRHDGEYRWYLVQGTPVQGPDGEIIRWVTVNIDIEDRKRREAHDRYLAEATAKLVSPLGSTNMLAEIARLAVPGLADVCAIGLFDGTSETARIETALADEAQRPIIATVHLRRWKLRPGSGESISDAVTDGRMVLIPEFSPSWIEACAPDAGQRDAALAVRATSLLCVPLTSRGRTMGMATFATLASGRRYTEQDSTVLQEVAARLAIALENIRLYEDLRATAEELRRANVAKDEFLGLVSHELRTPLTAIRGNAEVLVRSFERIDEDSRTQALDDIAAESKRLERIIDNLLVLARLEQGQDLEREPTVVARVVERVIARHQRTDPHRRFELVESEPIRPVSFAADYLEQVIENLLTNAAKYSPANETITIEIARLDGEVTIRVLDRGHGIANQDAQRLFEPFYRSDATSQQASGLGIGLAVCKRLVEAHGGTIWARRRPGGGTEFGFSVPTLDDVES